MLESLRHTVSNTISQTGVTIGLIVALLRSLNNAHKNEFKYKSALVDMIACPLMGGIAHKIGEASGLGIGLNMIWTTYMAFNTFVIIAIVMSPELREVLYKQFINKIKK